MFSFNFTARILLKTLPTNPMMHENERKAAKFILKLTFDKNFIVQLGVALSLACK